MAAKENREYKNSMFVDLFFEDELAEENDISLYNALHDEPLPRGTKVQKFRVENILYLNFKNDISFGVGGKIMVFGEHQSTVNENMPLRSLMYIGRAYEQIVPIRDRYKKSKVSLPKPEFYTFYNGQENWAKEKVLKLSDAYKIQGDDPMLELKVRVININPGQGHEVLEKCRILKEYGQFIDILRSHQAEGDTDVFRHTVEECIHSGILADYLKKKGSEVINMLIAEYDYDMDIEVQREEAYAEGVADGMAKGLSDGMAKGLSDGMEKGRSGKLIEQIRKKLSKGKNSAEIAEALEEPVETIQEIIASLKDD